MDSNAAYIVSALLVLTFLAGCFGGEEEPDDGTDGVDGGTGGMDGADGTAAGEDGDDGAGNQTEPVQHEVTFTADTMQGDVPLPVNFTIEVDAPDAVTGWVLGFGDGNTTDGTEPPETVPYTYQIAGNFTAEVTVSFDDGDPVTAQINITARLGEAGGETPQTHFEFGQSAGCDSTLNALDPTAPLTCISFHAGPAQPAIDGHWQALDERYWGMEAVAVPSMISGAGEDSDCAFVASDAHTVIATANNGADPCTGEVPPDTAFIFIYPYAEPATAMVLDFS